MTKFPTKYIRYNSIDNTIVWVSFSLRMYDKKRYKFKGYLHLEITFYNFHNNILNVKPYQCTLCFISLWTSNKAVVFICFCFASSVCFLGCFLFERDCLFHIKKNVETNLFKEKLLLNVYPLHDSYITEITIVQ